MDLKLGDNYIDVSPSQLAPGASATSPSCSSHPLMNIASKKPLHLGSLKSTDMKERTQSTSQTASRLPSCSTRQKEHCNSIYNLQHQTWETTTQWEKSSLSTTGQQHHSQECNNYRTTIPTAAAQETTTKVQHQWTSAQLTIAAGKATKEKERRAITKAKENIKEKDTTTTGTTKEKEKEDIKEDIHQDKETRSKEHQKDHQEKESNHSRKASKAKEKERMDATSAANRATLLRIAESQSIMLRKKDIKDINRIGIRIQHMTGIKTSGKIKDGIKTIRIGMDKSNSTQHNQQHHQIPQDHKQHRASTPWWTSTQRQLHQSTRLDRHLHRRMSCSQESTSWSTVGQQQMYAHHGLEQCIHSIRWSRTTSPSWGQSQALTSGSMATDGFISSMSKIDR